MSLKRNILASYTSQIYVMLVGIVMVPLYIRYMGAEAYGLVGFFVMLQSWFQLLDMGLTPTMARETARFNGGATDALSLRRLLRALEGVFVAVALLGGAAMIGGSGAIAGSWLKVQQLPPDEVQRAIMLMAVIVALRWVCGLYRGAISGFESLTWLGGLNIGVATARFVLVIPLFMYVGASPGIYFSYQLVVAVFEALLLIRKTYRLLPAAPSGRRTPWQWAPLRGVLKFSLSVAFTSSVWVLVTQTDKLVLSKLLPLADYAYFTLAVLVAGGIMVISGPISAALLPRMSKLAAAGDDVQLVRLYRDATQLLAAIAVPAALVLAFFAEQVLWAWTGDARMAASAAPVLALYAVGNCILALAAFPYYLQFAKGDLKLHLVGNGLFLVVLIPSLVVATLKYGATGAGWAWVLSNLANLLLWVPKVHGRFFAGLHRQWILHDVGTPVLLSAAVATLIHASLRWPHGRPQAGLCIVAISTLMLAVGLAGSATGRQLLANRFRKLRHGAMPP